MASLAKCVLCGAAAGSPHDQSCHYKAAEVPESPAPNIRRCTAHDCGSDRPCTKADCAYFTGGIGDVKSDARGSGARFNAGKPPVELIPVWLIAEAESRLDNAEGGDSAKQEAWAVLYGLGQWQRDETEMCEILRNWSECWTTDLWADCARVFDYGRKKYAEWNWAKGMPWSVPLACAVRHCLAILRGEEIDPESGLPHRGHVACNVVMLAQYESSYPEGDDRPWRLLAPAEQKAA